jgi:hypothetical protein
MGVRVSVSTGLIGLVLIDLRDGFLLYWSEIGNKAGGRPVDSSRKRRRAPNLMKG